ncbi:hypothetical protein [Nonomuraea solani]|nr:hypothetical protein [Nonomuraea solani]
MTIKRRAVISNGDLDRDWTFHIDHEQRRIHQDGHQDRYALSI